MGKVSKVDAKQPISAFIDSIITKGSFLETYNDIYSVFRTIEQELHVLQGYKCMKKRLLLCRSEAEKCLAS